VKDNLYVANVGDCEGVLLGQGSPIKINVRLNAGEPEEQARLKREFPHESDIYKCIKNTQYCYVKGRLQPTRSLGDFYLKYREYNFTKLHTFTGPYITHKPILTHYKLNDEQKYLVLATDGLWDELDEEEMNKVALHHQSGTLAKQLFNAALSKINIRNRTTFESL
jgi:pyruvate dehydrogenase phosphatase